MALEKIKMPQLGESVTEGTIIKWLVSVGDKISKYDPLAEVMTDKVTAEIPSSSDGIVKKLVAGEDETIETGKTICLIESDKARTSSITDEKLVKKTENSNDWLEKVDKSQKIRYSPAVLKLSQEHGIDLQRVEGSGAGGRITRKDILRMIESGHNPNSVKQYAEKPVTNNDRAASKQKVIEADTRFEKQEIPSASRTGFSSDTVIPVTGIRKAIASNMLRSQHEIPHAWTMIEADVTGLVEYRDAIKDNFKEKEGFSLTYFAFFVKAVALALKEYPLLNSMWSGDKIVQRKEINISIAIASQDALYVPVIKAADEKTIKGIAREIADFVNRAREGILSVDDMQGGTFTVNNTGSFGSVQSMGIINHPQAAILQIEAIVKRPVVIDGMIAIRDMVNLCLSLDHRILDGLICGRFMQKLKQILETITQDNTPIY